MENTNKGLIFMLVGVFLFSILSVAVKIIYKMGITETTLTPLFALFVSLISLIYNIIFKRDKFKIEKKDVKYIILHGIIGIAFVNLCFNRSLIYLDASLSIMILYLSCVLVFIFQKIARNKKFSKKSVIYMMLVILGLFISSNPNTTGKVYAIKGLMFAFGSSVGYAFYNINIEEKLNEIETTIIIMYAQFLSFIFLLIIYKPVNVFNVDISVMDTIILLGIAFVTSFLPMFFIMKGIDKLGAYKASIMGTMELPFTAILAFLFLGETMTIVQMIGMVIVILGAIKIKSA